MVPPKIPPVQVNEEKLPQGNDEDLAKDETHCIHPTEANADDVKGKDNLAQNDQNFMAAEQSNSSPSVEELVSILKPIQVNFSDDLQLPLSSHSKDVHDSAMVVDPVSTMNISPRGVGDCSTNDIH